MDTTSAYTDAQILIVDDERASVDAIRRTLTRSGFAKLRWTTEPREAVEICIQAPPDLVLLDLHMPGMQGDQVLERLREEMPYESISLPVIMLTGDATPAAKRRAFAAGARDFLSKPYHREEMLLRVRNHLEVRRIHEELQNQARLLEQRVRERCSELEQAQLELLNRLSRAAEYRDDDTGQHAQRVGQLSARIAGEVGLNLEQVELIWRAAALHDVGKIGISDGILLKPGKLSDDEMATMRRHVLIGADILSGGSSKYLQVAERIALTHHEWWDGNGYLGMRGDEIPIEGRIVAVADVFDALTNERPYKAAWSIEAAIQHIVGLRGTHFDPAMVDALLRVLTADGLLTGPPEQISAAEEHGVRAQNTPCSMSR